MDDPEFKVTVKHQMFGPELNQIFAFSPAFFLVRQYILLAINRAGRFKNRSINQQIKSTNSQNKSINKLSR